VSIVYELKHALSYCYKMGLQQMMEMLLNEIRAGQEKTEANRDIDREERKTDRKDLKELMKMMTANQAKTDVKFTELTEETGKTKMELQTVQVSLSAWANKLQEDLAEIRPK
jgi:beta-N-acetylglucosaminidase